jgi:N-methylhydantoinase B
MNDPFDGGIHLQDIFVFKPVFAEERLIGFATTTAHHGDVGGRLPGSSACDNTEIFQEGIRLPWLRLYDRGEPVEVVFSVLRANVRIPRMTLGDLAAQVAATSVAERALQELAARHGPERLAELMNGLIDYTERLVRQEIAGWPDGTATFTDYLDSDGIERADVRITATVTIEGDEITADLTDCAPMVRGSLNSTRSFVQACVYQAVRCALTVEIPNTSGAFRPVHVLTKPGTIAEVVMPGASSMRGVTGFRVLDAVNGALAQLVPDRVPAAGEGGNTLAIFGADRPDGGGRFVFYELIVGTWGGTPEADGNDGLTNPASLAANIPVEVAETEFPIRVERYALVPDSGGAGAHRGGLAVERAWRCLTPATSLIVRSDRAAHPPYGLQGGAPGALSSNVLVHADGTEEVLPSMFSITIEPGDLYVHRTAGGGGWGDPANRDPTAVEADRADGKVTRWP